MVVSFDTTEDVMDIEAKAPTIGLPGRVIPVPPEIEAGCGMAWSVPLDESDDLAQKMDDASIEYSAITLVEMYVLK